MSSEYGIPTAPVKETLSRRRYLQFSIRALLIALTVVAAVVGGIVATPLFAVIACLLYVGTSCVLLTTLFDGKGWIRGFAIGFTVPHILGYVVALNSFARPEGILVVFLVANAASVIAGLVISIVKGFLERRGGKVAVPQIPFLREWLSNE